jgi:hypothetical protein
MDYTDCMDQTRREGSGQLKLPFWFFLRDFVPSWSSNDLKFTFRQTYRRWFLQ